jgi:hypothetical protein
MKINKRLYTTSGISNVDNFSNDANNTPLGSRLVTVQTEVKVDQAKGSRMTSESETNLREEYIKPVVKQSMDHPLIYSLYVLPPFI